MCEYSGKLIAWLDRELPDREAADVATHLEQCAECQRAASAYEEIGAAFLACYEVQSVRRGPANESGTGPRRTPSCAISLEAAIVARPKRGGWRWAMAGGLAAAAVLAAVLLNLRPHHEQLPAPPPAESAPAIAFWKAVPQAAPNSMPGAAAVHVRRRPVRPAVLEERAQNGARRGQFPADLAVRDAPFALPKYTRKTERAAPFALPKYTRKTERAAPFALPTGWSPAEPTVEIALPADALFPPGAVPLGFSFIADVRPQP